MSALSLAWIGEIRGRLKTFRHEVGVALAHPTITLPTSMNPETTEPMAEAVRWLARSARFPAARLSGAAEMLVCVAALAAAEEARDEQRFLIQRRDPAQTSALRAHGLRRSQVHFKCDNSAKV